MRCLKSCKCKKCCAWIGLYLSCSCI